MIRTDGIACCEITCAETFPLEDPELFRFWMNRMPEERKRKVLALRHAESQRQSLGVGILLFRAMESRGLDGARTEIRAGAYGKPFLPGYPEFCFSLSHSGNRVICAVHDHPVGCDVESFGRDLTHLARRFYHPEEQAALEETPEDLRQMLFFRLWTRKESRLKATGEGISAPMSGFSVIHPLPGIWYDDGPVFPDCAACCCVIQDERPAFHWREVSLM